MRRIKTYNQQFVDKVRKLYPNGIILYHQTDRSNVESILREGLREGGPEEAVYTVFDKIVNRAGNWEGSVHLRITLPIEEADQLWPEDATYRTEDMDEIDESYDLLYRNYLRAHPDLRGGDILTNHVPPERIEVAKRDE